MIIGVEEDSLMDPTGAAVIRPQEKKPRHPPKAKMAGLNIKGKKNPAIVMAGLNILRNQRNT